ncbi:phenylalanine--tRNA ligase subunit beta, partial [Francisellaceae bacterium]|nr:phenylalanine--tRNA ligase subunit beta [Francisellaceae bacterium]
TVEAIMVPKKLILLRAEKVNRVLGCDFDTQYIEETLRSLGLTLSEVSVGVWEVLAPSYRFDINIEEDLIEEVGRVYGYASLPENLPVMGMNVPKISDQEFDLNTAKQVFVQCGYHEVINYSFIDPKLGAAFFDGEGITLQNPISNEMSVMRQSLIPGLLTAFKSNLNRQQERVRIFEEGVVFNVSEGRRTERLKIAGLVYGNVFPLGWNLSIKSDFYTVKSDVEMLLGGTKKVFEWQPLTDCDYLHPGKSASILLNGKIIGVLGVLHPEMMKVMQIKGHAPVIFELSWSDLSQKSVPVFHESSKYPSISRDLALVIDIEVSCQEITDCVREAAGSLLQEVRVFDVYQGENLPKNKKSIALNLILQDSSETLKEEVINSVVSRILTQTEEKTGATLRE